MKALLSARRRVFGSRTRLIFIGTSYPEPGHGCETMRQNGAGSPRLEVAEDGERARVQATPVQRDLCRWCGRFSVAETASLLLGVSGKVNLQDAWGIIPSPLISA